MALLFACDDEIGEDRDHGAVHGHGDGDFIKRDTVEEDFHILNAVDRHASFADITDNAGVIGVVATVGGEVEGDGNALLTSRKRLAVEGVRLFGGGEPGILTDGPGAARIHRGFHAAREGLKARQAAHMGQACRILGGVERLDGDAFQRLPVERFDGLFQLLLGEFTPRILCVRHAFVLLSCGSAAGLPHLRRSGFL